MRCNSHTLIIGARWRASSHMIDRVISPAGMTSGLPTTGEVYVVADNEFQPVLSHFLERYNKQPLVVRGLGAGAEVTAGGVFSDLLQLASNLGAPSC
ncbi:bifunctional aspartokinase/homoserine dehydrogenase I [Artemisia annua]|uniref:Bifunctional aspartokinase/homoserine dehydrogenase I n=1 Tax=Artemisia annua TaxID=35608 RepID=A0A2U1PUY3_ARTAN|nr:bifunctional aspartokinase/homoserine dehydrogenase I [Artemisia annua]